jgi:hypothetical protein
VPWITTFEREKSVEFSTLVARQKQKLSLLGGAEAGGAAVQEIVVASDPGRSVMDWPGAIVIAAAIATDPARRAISIP